MKFFVAFAALVAVAVANPNRFQLPSILPAIIEKPAFGPVIVEDLPAAGPAIAEPVFQQPAFGPALIDFPLNSDGTLIDSPVAVGPVPQAASPLVQIIINVAKPEAGAGAGAEPGTLPSIDPEYVIDPLDVIDDVPVEVDGVVVADLPMPVEPILIGTPQLPPAAVNIPGDLN